MNEELLKYLNDCDIKWDKSKSSRDIQYELEKKYAVFLDNYGGYCGVINNQHYVNLYSASEIIDYNIGYNIQDFLPQYLLLGAVDDEALVTNGKEYYLAPFIGMDPNESIKIAEGFENLIENLAYKEELY
ncbi:MAG: hypothetical protein K2M78_12820 [Lachnospiraceae bacterium]|nr:hypothetical protein [Lachnospiraceae bacterium]